MIQALVIFLIVIAIVGVIATAVRLAIDYFDGDIDGVTFDGTIFIIIMSPFLGWIFIAHWIFTFFDNSFNDL